MKTKYLKKLIPIGRNEYRREILPLFGILMAANFLFAYFFEFLHENYFLLGSLLILNVSIAFRTSYLTWRRLLYLTDGSKRVLKTSLLLLIAEMIPIYHLYLLFICMSSQSKKSLSPSALTYKPLGICSVGIFILFALSFPRAPKTLPLVLDPLLNYISNIALDSYRVFKIKDELGEKCIESDDFKCFQKALKREVFPGTNTAAILAVAADAMIIFMKKVRAEEKDMEKVGDDEHNLKFSKVLLETNSYFLNENNCHNRVTPLNLSGPVPMVTGLQTAYILQIVDTMISKEFARVASNRLSQLADQSLKKSKDEKTSRSIANIKDKIAYDGTHTCSGKIH